MFQTSANQPINSLFVMLQTPFASAEAATAAFVFERLALAVEHVWVGWGHRLTKLSAAAGSLGSVLSQVDFQPSPPKLKVVELCDCGVGFVFLGKFDKGEPTRAAGCPIGGQKDIGDLPGFRE